MTTHIELKPASPGKHAERISVGLTSDWKRVTLELQNEEGETVTVELDQHKAFQLAGNLQGNAFCVKNEVKL